MKLMALGWEEGKDDEHTKEQMSPTTAAAAAATKSLQSCLTLCDPIDSSPPGIIRHLVFSRQEYWSGVSLHSLQIMDVNSCQCLSPEKL